MLNKCKRAESGRKLIKNTTEDFNGTRFDSTVYSGIKTTELISVLNLFSKHRVRYKKTNLTDLDSFSLFWQLTSNLRKPLWIPIMRSGPEILSEIISIKIILFTKNIFSLSLSHYLTVHIVLTNYCLSWLVGKHGRKLFIQNWDKSWNLFWPKIRRNVFFQLFLNLIITEAQSDLRATQ